MIPVRKLSTYTDFSANFVIDLCELLKQGGISFVTRGRNECTIEKQELVNKCPII